MKVLTQIIVCTSLYLQVICQKDLFHQGSFWKYSYEGHATAASLVGEEASSRFDITAELQITATSGVVFAQLQNIKTSLYNGPSNNIPEDQHPTDLPEIAATHLGLPFVIDYNGTFIDSIRVLEYDPLWSINMKRAIASLFQLELSNLERSASLTSEENLYGTCNNIEYSVENKTDKTIVTKTIDHNECQNLPVHAWSSAPKFDCQKDLESHKMSNTIRKYTLKNLEIEEIESKRRYYSQPFNANGEAQQSYQYQHLKLSETSTTKEEKTLPDDLIKKSLNYEININNLNQDRTKNVTNRQHNIMGVINYYLDNVVSNLEEKHLDKDVLDFHRDLMFLYYHLFPLDADSFREIYDEYSRGTSFHQESKLSIFLELLPQSGSENSVQFIKELIVKQKVKDITALKILSIFPIYVKQHSEKLLNDMEELLTLSHKYDRNVREAAVLSFANLVYQTYVAGKCSTETFENYALKYFNLFSESEDYAKRQLYIQGLENLQLGSVPTYLKSVSKNKNNSHHIRLLAAMADVNSTKVYETYWPIFTNKTENLELRIVAMMNLLMGQPTKSRLMTIYWHIKAEQNPHLYNFFYTTIISLHKSSYPCFEKLSSISKHLVRYLPAPKPKKWSTGNYMLDYSDTENSFGGLLHFALIGNEKTDNPNIVYLNLNNYALDSNMKQISVFLKLQGVGHHLSDVLKKIEIGNFDMVGKILNNLKLKAVKDEEVHVEMIVKVQDKNVFCTYLDGKKFDHMKQTLKNAKMLMEYQLNHQSILFPFTKENMEPTDLGTLLIKSVVSNSIASTRGSLVSEAKDSKHLYNSDVDFRYYTYTVSFLELYNPLSDMWHGVERGKKFQTKFLINGTLSVDNEASQIEFTENRNGDEYLNVLQHSHSYTYLVSNGTGALQYHCPNCSNIYNITQGPVKEEVQLVDKLLDHNETKLQVKIFDCDSFQEIKDIFHKLHTSHRANAEAIPFAKPLLHLMHYLDYVSYIPCQGRCGMSLLIKPTTSDSTELNYKLSISNTTEANLMYQLSSQLHKISSADLEDLWNATALVKWNEAENLPTLYVTIDSDTDDETVCISSDPSKEEISTNLIVKWGHTNATKQPTCVAVDTVVHKFLHKISKLLSNA